MANNRNSRSSTDERKSSNGRGRGKNSGNFANDRERAREAGRKGGQARSRYSS